MSFWEVLILIVIVIIVFGYINKGGNFEDRINELEDRINELEDKLGGSEDLEDSFWADSDDEDN